MSKNTLTPIAVVKGEPYYEIHQDLYIPPEALEVLLDSFQGPLDLLLYLIKKQNIDILDIPIAKITRQYMGYINLIEKRNLNLAADYLVMASVLAEIKSRMLLPVQKNEEEEEEDPRLVLVRRLQAYEQFKRAAEQLDQIPRLEREYFKTNVDNPFIEEKSPPYVDLNMLINAMKNVLKNNNLKEEHQITRPKLSIKDKIIKLMSFFQVKKSATFKECLLKDEGRAGVVVTFMAVLELSRKALIVLTQTKAFGDIHIKNNDGYE